MLLLAEKQTRNSISDKHILVSILAGKITLCGHARPGPGFKTTKYALFFLPAFPFAHAR